MKFIQIILLFFTILGSSQTTVTLRNVSFIVPKKFRYIDKENTKINYDLFYENGKISIDSTNTEFFPKIAYQYYENPGGTEDSKIVLQRLNEIMTKDFKPDTLIIDGENDLSIAKYEIMGNSLFEIKSLGENGWINIGYTDLPENDQNNFNAVKEIAYSISHDNKYNFEYKEAMKQSGNSSKIVIIGLIVLIIVNVIRKLTNKNVT